MPDEIVRSIIPPREWEQDGK